jgi:hypothetical protein
MTTCPKNWPQLCAWVSMTQVRYAECVAATGGAHLRILAGVVTGCGSGARTAVLARHRGETASINACLGGDGSRHERPWDVIA